MNMSILEIIGGILLIFNLRSCGYFMFVTGFKAAAEYDGCNYRRR